MLDIGDLDRINPNNAEDFLKFISYNRDMFLHRVTAQLGSFVENGFLKTLFDKSSQAMDKAQLLVKMFGKSLYALSRSWDNFATCAYTLYGDMDEDTELECPSINNDLFTSTSSSNTKTTPNPKKDKQKARVTVDKQVKNQSTMANPDVQTSAKKPYKELKWYQHSIPTLMKKHKPKAKNTLNKKSGITGNVLDMINTHITPRNLVATGAIISELHIHATVHYFHSPLQPGYICDEKGQISGIVESLEQPDTVQKLLEGIIFCPFIIETENISIFVGCLCKIWSNTKIIGHNYSASLFYKYKGNQSVFFQCVNQNYFSITIYQNSQIIAVYKDISPNAVWRKTWNSKINLRQYIICNKSYYNFTKIKASSSFITIASGSVEEWHQDAQILLHVIKKFLMLNFANSEKDRETIANLYMQGFLNITIPSPADVFWNCFRDSYNANPNGIDGKIRILSIIGENFIYKDMIDELEVSPNSINAARKFSRINGPEYKENINMSSYKVDAKTQLYLKDQKNALWEKFSAIYPDGMKCTSFIAHLQNSQFKY
ncbi:hypothetical protein RhiirA1_460880 [Rhizophagus irregularis]|uniref:Uncharacterized protein n=1 Tax=Rhizophagus irregularis TaxID=588596 RepID=A0A2N0RQH4_9GLOM|nr:hypothetical protein RhiirA1_460880 [Rhizophagus irregularis]